MKPELRLTDTGTTEQGGLRIFALDLYVNGQVKKQWLVNSGQPDSQTKLTYNDPHSYSGDMRPIPEAVYNIGSLEFAGGKFDWNDSWGPGLGDFWANIKPVGGETKRRAFGFHWDENRRRSPGSAGCVVFATKKDVESFVAMMRKYDPEQLVVDYGFGTVPKAPTVTTAEKPEVYVHKTWANRNGQKIRVEHDIPAGEYVAFSAGGDGSGAWVTKWVPA